MNRATVLQAIAAARASADALREQAAATTSADQRRARRKRREAGQRLKAACAEAEAQGLDEGHPVPWITGYRGA